MTSNLLIVPTPSISKDFSPMSVARIQAIVKKRSVGIWTAQDTMDDLFHILTEDVEKTDVAITMNLRMCAFNKLNMGELLSEIKNWKSLKLTADKENICEFEFAGKTYYMWVVQDPTWWDNEETNPPMCPLIPITFVLSSGYTYITARRQVAEWVCDQLRDK